MPALQLFCVFDLYNLAAHQLTNQESILHLISPTYLTVVIGVKSFLLADYKPAIFFANYKICHLIITAPFDFQILMPLG
jgi:hypothetical protein